MILVYQYRAICVEKLLNNSMESTNITWHDGEVTPHDREQLLKQQGCVVWLTGLSGSGKSTIAVALEKKMFEHEHLAYRLDGDNIRHGLNKDLGFSPEHRTENIRRIGEVSKLFADSGVIVLTSFISPYTSDRNLVRTLMPQGKFVEVYVKCDVTVCEERDPKGLYKKARAGEIKEFTGISAPYEAPEHPELVVDTAAMPLHECVGMIFDFLRAQRVIS